MGSDETWRVAVLGRVAAVFAVVPRMEGVGCMLAGGVAGGYMLLAGVAGVGCRMLPLADSSL